MKTMTPLFYSEFDDPDTVALMEWISSSTPKNAAFTGSMQLLAGVKLCTGRPLTNHPHFEDKELRERTKEVRKKIISNSLLTSAYWPRKS